MKILVTGGGSDIGHAIALRRAKAGDDVVITATTKESLDKALARLESAGAKATGFVFKFEQPTPLPSNDYDALILNAFEPVTKIAKLHEIPFADVTRYMHSNIDGNVWLLQQVLPQMKSRGFGRLVLISSLSVQVGTPNYAMYAASKAALESLFLNLAVDYGADGILSNIARLGLFKTSRTALFWKRQEYRDKVGAMIPQGMMGEPEQVAQSLDVFLDKNSYVNGASLNISGGLPLTTSGRTT